MSASNTNLEKQKRRHRGPLVGIAVALGVALALFLGYMFFLADTETPEPTGQTPTEEAVGIPAEGSPETQDAIADPDGTVIEETPPPSED